jgi:predicted amidohydrolase YtcJ
MRVRVLSICVAAVLVTVLGAAAAPGQVARPRAAQVVLYGGTVVTMDGKRPRAHAVAIRGGRIVAVGSNRAILRRAGPRTRRIDLHGRTVLPGFVDSHSHLFNAAADQGLSLEQAQQMALEHGITALGDMFVPPDFLQTMRDFDRAGLLHVRTSLYLLYNTNCGDVLGDWYLSEGPLKSPARMLRVPGVKIFADGGSCGRPAVSWVYPPGAPGAGTQGDLWVTRPQLTAAIVTAQSHGWQVAVHALGDRALDVVLDSFSAALGGGPNVLRHRIEHNTFVRDDQLPRYAQTGLVTTVFGAFGTCAFNAGGFGRADLVPGTEPWLWRWRDLVGVSSHPAWSSDWPVFTVDPLTHLYGFVTRREVGPGGAVCQPEPEQANDTVPVARALRMMTIDAAYALGQDSAIGSLRPGKLADLVLLSRNPLAIDPDELPGVAVLMTMVGGRVEYCAPGAGAYCG